MSYSITPAATASEHPDEAAYSSVAGIAAAREAGELPERFHQTPDAYAANVNAFKSAHRRALLSGAARPMVTSRVDLDRAQIAISRQRRSGAWRRTGALRLRVPGRVRAVGREARAGQRGRRARRHAATALRDDGDSPDGKSDPAPARPSLPARHVLSAELRGSSASPPRARVRATGGQR